MRHDEVATSQICPTRAAAKQRTQFDFEIVTRVPKFKSQYFEFVVKIWVFNDIIVLNLYHKCRHVYNI